MIVTRKFSAVAIDDAPGELHADREEHPGRSAPWSTAARRPSSRWRTSRRGRRTTPASSMPAIGSIQNDSAFRRGNAMSGAPIISGRTKFARPAKTGMMKRKISSDAWTLKSPLKVFGVDELAARRGELGAHQHRHQAADEQEEERGDRVLDADHLVVGVDAEVVLPRVRAVAGVVLGARRRARRPSRTSSRRRRGRRGRTAARRAARSCSDRLAVEQRVVAVERAQPDR